MVTKPTPEALLLRAAEALRRGEIVAVPTETVYGLAVDAANPEAVQGLYALKERPDHVPMPVALAEAAWLERYVPSAPPAAQVLADRFWPGPLTLVLQLEEGRLAHLVDDRGTLALRVPAHPVTLGLIRSLGRSIVLTSANIHGQPEPTTAEGVRQQFESGVALILKGGPSPLGVPSTIVEVLENRRPRILRQGALRREDVASTIPDLQAPCT